MSEQPPSHGRFTDLWGPRWEQPEWSAPWTDDSTATTALDFDSVPTRDAMDAGFTGPVISVSDEPHAIALPDIYEPGYAYPLIVWFHRAGANEEEIFDVLPQISERNYLALALRGNVDLGDEAAEWSTGPDSALELARRIEDAVSKLSEFVNVHPDRIYLAGAGTGGTTALELMLQRPEAFAGAACLGGVFPEVQVPLARFRGLRGRRVLLATALENRDVKIVDLVASGRLLYTAGMQVGTRVYQASGELPTPKMLRDMDHWIMDSIQSAVRLSVR
jgi:phospholipase/carboxylesterase